MPVYRCALTATWLSQVVVNVWHLSAADGMEETIADEFIAAVVTPYKTFANSDVSFDSIAVTNLTTKQQTVLSINLLGTHIGESVPPQCAPVISWTTGLAGRKYRGRTYVIGLSEDLQNDGALTPGAETLLESLAIALYQTWPNAVTGSLCVYHKATASTTVILGRVVRDVVYTQRRRTVGEGR